MITAKEARKLHLGKYNDEWLDTYLEEAEKEISKKAADPKNDLPGCCISIPDKLPSALEKVLLEHFKNWGFDVRIANHSWGRYFVIRWFAE